AGEGDSPIEVPNLTELRLTNLASGVRLVVAVAAIDRVGYESSRPSGVAYMLPRELRVLNKIRDDGRYSHPSLFDDSLFVIHGGPAAPKTMWFNTEVPELPSHVATIPGGRTTFALDGYLYNGADMIALDPAYFSAE